MGKSRPYLGSSCQGVPRLQPLQDGGGLTQFSSRVYFRFQRLYLKRGSVWTCWGGSGQDPFCSWNKYHRLPSCGGVTMATEVGKGWTPAPHPAKDHDPPESCRPLSAGAGRQVAPHPLLKAAICDPHPAPPISVSHVHTAHSAATSALLTCLSTPWP